MKRLLRRATFYRNLHRLTPGMVEALIRHAVAADPPIPIRCRGITPTRTWWIVDEHGKHRL